MSEKRLQARWVEARGGAGAGGRHQTGSCRRLAAIHPPGELLEKSAVQLTAFGKEGEAGG